MWFLWMILDGMSVLNWYEEPLIISNLAEKVDSTYNFLQISGIWEA
jgi:hypothetical protein